MCIYMYITLSLYFSSLFVQCDVPTSDCKYIFSQSGKWKTQRLGNLSFNISCVHSDRSTNITGILVSLLLCVCIYLVHRFSQVKNISVMK